MPRNFQRRAKRLILGSVVVLVFCVGIFALKVGILPYRSYVSRINIVVGSSPVSIWSWDRVDHSLVILTVPSDTAIDGIHGYGRYSLDALWRLGVIDSKASGLLSESLADLFSLPNSWYIGNATGELVKSSDARAYGRQLFSLGTIPKFLSHFYRSNIPFSLFFSFTRELGSLHSDQITYIDISKKIYRQEVDLPDGTKQYVIAPEQVDAVLAGVFEDDAIRKEALNVTVNNTIDMPGLGNSAARLISGTGVHVVSVGNDTPAAKTCRVSGSEASLRSKTAKTIVEILHCVTLISKDEKSSDLTVDVGSEFARRYQKYE